MNVPLIENAATNTPSHLLYLPSRDLWIGATWVPDCGDDLGPGWRFKNATDACLWLSEPEAL